MKKFVKIIKKIFGILLFVLTNEYLKNENEYYCFLNDRYSGFIVERSVLYKDNGKTMSGYGIWDAYNLTNEAIDNKNAEGIYDRP